MALSEYIQMLTALFAIMNPISVIPLYLAFTDSMAEERTRIARQTAIAVATILIVSIFAGTYILDAFNISIGAFRVAGGILLIFVAFNMLQARVGRTRHTPEEDEEAIDSSSVAVVPLALPILAGPGAISTVILFRYQAEGALHILSVSLICLMMASIIWLVFHLAPLISRKMSRTAMNITTRVMGLLLAAMAIEFIAGGLKALLPGLEGV